jgi:hypothetical protein
MKTNNGALHMNPTNTPCMGKTVSSLYYVTLSTYFGSCRAIFGVTTVERKVMNATLHTSTYTLCRFIALSNTDGTIPVTAPSKAWACGRSHAEIAGSNPAGVHGSLSLVSVVCFQVEVSASSWSLHQWRPTGCSEFECDRKAWIMRKPWLTRGCCAMGKKCRISRRKSIKIYEIYVGQGLKYLKSTQIYSVLFKCDGCVFIVM